MGPALARPPPASYDPTMVGLLRRLKRHPFPVEAWFDRVVAVSFAFPHDRLRHLVPEPLEIDTYGEYGFITVALVWTRGLRPRLLPRWMGQDFFLAGYRVFVRLRDERGRHLRGLKILRSETDRARMVFSGNLLTHYAYRRVAVDISRSEADGLWRVITRRPGGDVTLDLAFDPGPSPAAVPAGSPFPDWATARRFAGPMPYTFDEDGDGRFVVIEGRREEWHPRPIRIADWDVALFRETALADVTPVLANAFLVEAVPYRWEKGRLVTPPRDPNR